MSCLSKKAKAVTAVITVHAIMFCVRVCIICVYHLCWSQMLCQKKVLRLCLLRSSYCYVARHTSEYTPLLACFTRMYRQHPVGFFNVFNYGEISPSMTEPVKKLSFELESLR